MTLLSTSPRKPRPSLVYLLPASILVLLNLNLVDHVSLTSLTESVTFSRNLFSGRTPAAPILPHHVPQSPSPLSTVFRVHNHSFRPSHQPPFSTPQIIAVYTRARHHNSTLHDMYVYSSGVTMHASTRKLTVVACVVADQVHVAHNPFKPWTSPYGVTRCLLTTRPPPAARVSLLLLHDHALRAALSRTNRTVMTMPVSVPAGSIVHAPPGLRFHHQPRDVQRAVANHGVRMVASDITLATYPVDGVSLRDIDDGARARHRVCLMTQVKAYTYALRSWVEYHRALGVDKVFIADNDADRDVRHMFAARQDVEVLYWPWPRTQYQALSYILHAGRTRCEWLLFADVDEYALLGRDGVPRHERELGMYANGLTQRNREQVLLTYVQMAGQRLTPAREPFPLAYTTLESGQREDQGKSMCRTDVEWERHAIHRCNGGAVGAGGQEVSPAGREPGDVSEGGRMVHFHYRSWSEYQTKKRMGSASTKVLWKEPGGAVDAKPPTWFYRKAGARWTFFRERWRQVMRRHSTPVQTTVWTETTAAGRKRCLKHERAGGGAVRAGAMHQAEC